MLITIDWFSGISLIANFVGIAFISYQWREIQLNTKKDRQIQNLIRTIGESALAKSMGYDHQLELLKEDKGNSINEIKLLLKARDELRELHTISGSLQGAVNPDVSAVISSIEQLNKQEELRPRNAVIK